MDKQEKIEYIVRNYTSAMHAKAQSVLNDYHEAEDACQDAFIRLYRQIDKIDDVTSPSARAYCIKAAKNCAIDLQRKNRHETPAEEIFDDAETAAVYDFYPSDTADMVNDIETLPEKYRNIIRMRCLEEKSAEDTAKELKTNVNTVNTQLLRARNILKAKWLASAVMAACALILVGGITIRMLRESVSYSPTADSAEPAAETVSPESQDPDVSTRLGRGGENADFLNPAEISLEEAEKIAVATIDGASLENIVTAEKDPSEEGIYRILILYGKDLFEIKVNTAGEILSEEIMDPEKNE